MIEVTCASSFLVEGISSHAAMLLRTLWCRVGARKSINSTYLLPSLSGFTKHPTAAEPTQTSSVPSNRPASPSRPRCLDAGPWDPMQYHSSHQLKGLSGVLLSGHGLYKENVSQMRHYSTTLGKAVLKVAVVPGKRIPKGPRTKQPSRTNQPLKVENQVRQKQPWVCHRSPGAITCFKYV